VVFLGGSLVSKVPLAALAGVLMVTAVRMVEIHNVRAVVRATRSDAVVLVITAAVTLAFDLILAIEVGVAVAAVLALRAMARAAVAQVEPVEPQIDVDAEQRLLHDHIVTYRLDGALFFGAAQRFLTELTAVTNVKVVVLRLPEVQVLDATGAQALGEIVTELEGRGVTVLLKGIRPHHQRTLLAVGAIDALAHENHLFDDLGAALEHARLHVRRVLHAAPSPERVKGIEPASPAWKAGTLTIELHPRRPSSYRGRAGWCSAAKMAGMGFDTTLATFDEVCDDARRRESRAGFFAAMYRSVTREVRRRAEAGDYDDPARMEHFTEVFAARYLDAYLAWRAGQPTTAAWAAAFDASGKRRLVVLQHLLLGMNAHINLDLGVVAAQLAGDTAGLEAIRDDFHRINDMLGSQVEHHQSAVVGVSPWLGLLDRLGGRTDEKAVHFSLKIARAQAWQLAQHLAARPGAERASEIVRVDAAVGRLARRIVHPGPWLTPLLLVIRARETASVGAIMDAFD
jgi:anti-anti-sigma regulatory factor